VQNRPQLRSAEHDERHEQHQEHVHREKVDDQQSDA
jgi:hypothetical protein